MAEVEITRKVTVLKNGQPQDVPEGEPQVTDQPNSAVVEKDEKQFFAGLKAGAFIFFLGGLFTGFIVFLTSLPRLK